LSEQAQPAKGKAEGESPKFLLKHLRLITGKRFFGVLFLRKMSEEMNPPGSAA
jgi:hypothetical protein